VEQKAGTLLFAQRIRDVNAHLLPTSRQHGGTNSLHHAIL
jgi:hypothetical protein